MQTLLYDIQMESHVTLCDWWSQAMHATYNAMVITHAKLSIQDEAFSRLFKSAVLSVGPLEPSRMWSPWVQACNC